MRSGKLVTSDGVAIAYDWYPAAKPAGYLLLAHMMPATKESWSEFAAEMSGSGYSCLAIDLRGHGLSDGGPEGFKEFSDETHRKSIWDLDAAFAFLVSEGADPGRTILLGASIGANLSLQYLAEHPKLRGAVLLSAGENYRGITALPLARKLSLGQRLLLVAGRNDVRSGGSAASFNTELIREIPAKTQKELLLLDGEGHGTELLGQAGPAIRDFINKSCLTAENGGLE